jgi:hypothetical protein
MYARFVSASAYRLCLLIAIAILVATFCVAQTPADNQAGPAPMAIPSAIVIAKAVFVSNGGSDGGLFPEPFSGDPNRGYFTLFQQLKAMGRYELVSDPSQADLVMEIQLHAPNGPRVPAKQTGAADPLPFFQLVIYDAKTRFVLWTITEPIEWAILQKTHNRNFDEGISRVVADVQALSQPNPGALYPLPTPHLGSWQR